MALCSKCVSKQELHRYISHACSFKCMLFYLSVGACVHAALLSCKCVPWLSGQVTHHGDPFSASPDPRPQPLCLLWMCPLCLVPYPIILCPCSKNQCSPIVLLTCSTLPIVHNIPLLSPFIFGQLFFILLICSSGLLHFHLYLHSLPTFTLILFLTFYPFSLNLNTLLHPRVSAFSVNSIISLFSHIAHFSPYIFSCLLRNTDGLMQQGPTSLKMENRENVLLSSSATHLAPSPSIITLSSLLQCWVLLGQESGRLPLGNLGELNSNNFSFSFCSCGLPCVCPVLFQLHTLTCTCLGL